MRLSRLLLVLACCLPAAGAATPVEATDDEGRTVRLAQPARRAVTLTPHATELAFAAGAGAYVVATVTASDFPPEARTLPRVGDGLRFDPERTAAHAPDLLIGWHAGPVDDTHGALARLRIPLYVSAPRTMDDIPGSVLAYGRLFGTQAEAAPAAASLQARLDALRTRHAGRTPVRVMVLAGGNPMYTLTGRHIVSSALALCGGVNAFADSPGLAPRIGPESALAARPELIVTGTPGGAPTDAPPDLPAVLHPLLRSVDADSLYRPGPRMVDAAERLCALIEETRSARGG